MILPYIGLTTNAVRLEHRRRLYRPHGYKRVRRLRRTISSLPAPDKTPYAHCTDSFPDEHGQEEEHKRSDEDTERDCAGLVEGLEVVVVVVVVDVVDVVVGKSIEDNLVEHQGEHDHRPN